MNVGSRLNFSLKAYEFVAFLCFPFVDLTSFYFCGVAYTSFGRSLKTLIRDQASTYDVHLLYEEGKALVLFGGLKSITRTLLNIFLQVKKDDI